MKARSLIVRAALYAYPREFRSQFGEQICADIEDDASAPFHAFFDMIKGGMAMRLDSLMSDLRYAVRRLSRAPLFVAIVLLTFALGIGANIAVFSVLNDVILRPLPFARTGSIVVLMTRDPRGDKWSALSLEDVSDLRRQSRLLEKVAGVAGEQPALLIDGKPYATAGTAVTPEYLSIFGITVQLGRVLTADDAKPGVHRVMISNELWHKRFGGSSDVIGRTISLDNVRFEIVGVMRPGQILIDPNSGALTTRDFLRLMPNENDAAQRGARTAGGVAMLAPGVNVARANAEFALISSRLAQSYPKTDKGWQFSVRPLRDFVFGDVSSIWLLFVAVFGVLVVACANVGNMLAARWSSRDRELAIRRSLGASSSRIASQLFVETAILAVGGAVLGIGLAYAGLAAMHDMIVRAVPLGSTISLNLTSLLFASVVVIVATILAGLSPLLALRSTDLQSVLKSAGRGGDASGRHRLRAALVIVEVALTLALVIVSGLMLRTYMNLINTPLGIRPSGVVATDPLFLPDRYSTPLAARTTYRALLSRLQALPGVDAAALAWFYPQSDSALESGSPIFGQRYDKMAPLAATDSVSPDYFKTFGIPVEAGRAFTDRDIAGAEPVAIVNDTFVHRYLHGMHPLGARVGIQTGPTKRVWATIVGVAGTERLDVASPVSQSMMPEVYTPIAQRPQGILSMAVHAPKVDPETVGREIQSAFAAEMPLVPPPDTFTIAERIMRDTVYVRFVATLLAVLSAIALLLALSGVFAVMSFSVTQRVREFGIRIALGATTAAILSDVLRRSLSITAAGCAIGLIIGAIAARAISSQINVSPFDPLTFASVSALIVVSSTLASIQPALRATRVEPVESLRYE